MYMDLTRMVFHVFFSQVSSLLSDYMFNGFFLKWSWALIYIYIYCISPRFEDVFSKNNASVANSSYVNSEVGSPSATWKSLVYHCIMYGYVYVL